MNHIKVVVTLTIVVLGFSLAVFGVHQWSAPLLEQAIKDKANEAKFEVLPSLDKEDDRDALNMWYAATCPDELAEGEVCDSDTHDFKEYSISKVNVIEGKGYVYEVAYKGYSGMVTYLIGLDEAGLVTGFKVVAETESTDLGHKIVEDDVKNAFPGLTLEETYDLDYDTLAGATATLTWGGLVKSLQEVKEFHSVAFEGVVLETPEERLLRFKEEITSAGAVFADVSSDYDLADMSIVKVETANDDEAIIYTVEFATDYTEGSANQYLIAIDLETAEIIGMRVVDATDTLGYGSTFGNEDYDDQFAGLSFDDALAGNIDAMAGTSGAPITTGALKVSLAEVVTFHKVEFEGVVLETPAEKLVRLKLEIAGAAAIFADVSGDYTLGTGSISKVETVNTDEAMLYSVKFATTYTEGSYNEYIIVVDLDTDEIIGLRVIAATDTAGFGSTFADEAYDDQFTGMTFAEGLAGEIDAMAGTSGAPVTTGALKATIVEVIEFHNTEVKGIVVGPEEAPLTDLQTAYPDAVTFTSIYGDMTQDASIINIYEAKNAAEEVIGYVYFAKASGAFGGTIKYVWSFDVTGLTIALDIVDGSESWSHSGYDGDPWGTDFVTSPWLAQFEAIQYDSILTTPFDAIAGVSETTNGMNTSLAAIATYHTTENVGGAE